VRRNVRSESNLVRAIIDLLNLSGCVAVRFNNQPTAQVVRGQFFGYRRLNNPRGIPDIVGVAPTGRAIWIEAKTDDGRVSKDQKLFLDTVHHQGAIAMVARSVDDVAAVISIMDRTNWRPTLTRTW
jgi:hypothetical protein